MTGKVVVANWVTLDGVMQAPGRADEDPRDGFTHGGWAMPFSDPVVAAKMGERMSTDFEWLFGRRSYDDLLESWNARGGPFRDALNTTRKHVVSGDPATTLRWPNSELLHGDVPAEVAALTRRSDANLVIMGSGVLIDSLAKAGVIDEYVLMVAPIVLGEGRRLFGPGVRQSLRLLDCTPVSTGALVITYAA
ncbi:dihydrofolate reductase family protein [Mycolicibacterium sp. P1-18]|uniref:dihydrofolate reductase family protein n=1 Tax=Mycolicibacterium sp. P1-18 TaxID=2024615 RepID=UPI001F5B0342|nr:dihydrofolate reductase family protein [Mycolicibacterium sp. P1-18]